MPDRCHECAVARAGHAGAAQAGRGPRVALIGDFAAATRAYLAPFPPCRACWCS